MNCLIFHKINQLKKLINKYNLIVIEKLNKLIVLFVREVGVCLCMVEFLFLDALTNNLFLSMFNLVLLICCVFLFGSSILASLSVVLSVVCVVGGCRVVVVVVVVVVSGSVGRPDVVGSASVRGNFVTFWYSSVVRTRDDGIQ